MRDVGAFVLTGHESLEVVLRSHPHVAERYFADLIA